MASWAEAEAEAKRAAARASTVGNGEPLFISLKNDGDKCRMVIVGDPEQRKVYWVGNRSEVVTSATVVPPGTKVKTKWLLNAFDLGTKRMMIFECNQQTFRALVSVRERFPFDKWAIEVKRNGAAGDTNTTYAVLPDKELTPEQKAYIAKQDTHDLTVFSGATTHLSVPSNGNGTSIEEAVRNEFQDDEIPF